VFIVTNKNRRTALRCGKWARSAAIICDLFRPFRFQLFRKIWFASASARLFAPLYIGSRWQCPVLGIAVVRRKDIQRFGQSGSVLLQKVSCVYRTEKKPKLYIIVNREAYDQISRSIGDGTLLDCCPLVLLDGQGEYAKHFDCDLRLLPAPTGGNFALLHSTRLSDDLDNH